MRVMAREERVRADVGEWLVRVFGSIIKYVTWFS